MNEVLFKAKRKDNGNWLEAKCILQLFCQGQLEVYFFPRNTPIEVVKGADGNIYTCESCANFVRVDETTLCRYTSNVDKNGKMIFEGDVFDFEDNQSPKKGIVKFGKYRNPCDDTKGGHFGFYVDWQPELYTTFRKDLVFWANNNNVEIVGNVFDNPELLRKESESV